MFLDILDEKSPTNIIDWTKLTIEIWSKIVEKMSVFVLRLLWKKES